MIHYRAWASSAPLMYFPGGGVDPGAFDHKVKEDFLNAGCNERTITNGLAAIMSLSKTGLLSSSEDVVGRYS
ncbi:unnamed protein product [Anisakis simplex]|uniref:Succinyl-diaminopimelate desuccinylase n=1 Tax=Anisakis simplex TaxID=6269 RepID=A0A0M3JQF1_ANISI|nr:unnamed protein product [Anisakis simplex]